MVPRVYPADLLEVTAPVASAAARRLTTAAAVRAMIGSPDGDDALLETLIDRATGLAATWCALAKAVDGSRPTFARETLRATWFNGCVPRAPRLRLPWRLPVTGITSVIEDGVTLAAGTDFRLMSAMPGVLARLSDGNPTLWSTRAIVVTFVAGLDLVTAPPPEIEEGAIEHVKAMYAARDRDPNVRSQELPDVWSEAFNVWGGDTNGDCPLVPKFAASLQAFKDPMP